MLENEVITEISPSCSSCSSLSCEVIDITEKENGSVVPDNPIHQDIFDDLVEDAIWDLVFEIHKSIRLGFFVNLENEKKKYLEEAKKDIFGQKVTAKVPAYQISCPICKNKSCATKYASHLAKCIGISGRSSSRVANKKLADLDENDSQSDSNSVCVVRKRHKKGHGKKYNGKRHKSRPSSRSSVESSANYEDMTPDEIKAFFTQRCGVITRTSRKCMNSNKCSQHTDDEKRDIRHCFRRDTTVSEQLANDGQIDIDTVDITNGEFYSN